MEQNSSSVQGNTLKGDVKLLVSTAVAYVIAHHLAFYFPNPGESVMAIWPAGGVGLAALLLSPVRLWWAIVAVIYIVGIGDEVLVGNRSLQATLGYTTVNVIESVSSAFVIMRWSGWTARFARVKEIVAFVVGVIFINALGASIGAWIAAVTRNEVFAEVWETWYVADCLGTLLIAPFFVTLVNVGTLLQKSRTKQIIEFVLSLAIWCYLSHIAFSHTAGAHLLGVQPYQLIAIMIWPALRFGVGGVATFLTALAIIAFTSESVAAGPLIWGGDNPTERLLFAQVFLTITTISGLFLSASYAETKKAETSAKESRRLLQSIADGTNDAVFVKDASGRYIFANEATFGFIGKPASEVIGYDDAHVFPPEAVKVIREIDQKAIENRKATNFEEHVTTFGGDSIIFSTTKGPIFDESGKIGGLFGIARDVTRLKQLEKERQRFESQSQQINKLESLGVLAGGIAHDFNNLLQGIFGNIGIAIEHLQKGAVEKIAPALRRAMECHGRASDLTGQLLTFSRGGAPIKKNLDVGPMIKNAAEFALSGSKITLQTDIAPDLRPTEVDPYQFTQVIDNLVRNAKEAMSGSGTGTVVIKARNLSEEDPIPALLSPGKYLLISIKDNGVGIPPEILNQIFDPFFTTKTKGQGLGLAIVYSIIKKHGGHIHASSIPGRETVFDIFLPASSKPLIAISDAEIRDLQSGRGRVLVMDDEPAITDLASAILRDLGYEVECAANGEEVVRLYTESVAKSRKFSVVILDLTVRGGMGGKDALTALLKIDSSVKAIVSSGYANDPILSSPESFGFRGVLTKPYKAYELADVLLRVMAEN